MNLVTIVPPEKGGSGAMMAHGTKVLLPDGQELDGVKKVVLTAEVDSLWEAVITVHARVVPITAECTRYVDGLAGLPAWRRWLLKLAGFKLARPPGVPSKGTVLAFDTTALEDNARKFAAVESSVTAHQIADIVASHISRSGRRNH